MDDVGRHPAEGLIAADGANGTAVLHIELGAADGGDARLVEGGQQLGGDGEQVAVGGEKHDALFGVALQPLELVGQSPLVRCDAPGGEFPLVAAGLAQQHLAGQQGVLLARVERQQQPLAGGQIAAGVGELQRHRHHVAGAGHHPVFRLVVGQETGPDGVGHYAENQRLAVAHQALDHGRGGGTEAVDVVVIGEGGQQLLAQQGGQRGSVLIGVEGDEGGVMTEPVELVAKAALGVRFAAPQHHGDGQRLNGQGAEQAAADEQA